MMESNRGDAAMTDTPEIQAKPKKRRWLSWTLLGLFVVAWTGYGLAHYNMYVLPADTKLGNEALSRATRFAIGLRYVEGRTVKSDYIRGNKRACDTHYSKNVNFYFCTLVSNSKNLSGCSWWRFEKCQIFEATDYLLIRPDLLGPSLHALMNPCRYLPNPSDVDASAYGSYYKEARCGMVKSGYPHKIIVNFFNANGDIISRFVREPIH